MLQYYKVLPSFPLQCGISKWHFRCAPLLVWSESLLVVLLSKRWLLWVILTKRWQRWQKKTCTATDYGTFSISGLGLSMPETKLLRWTRASRVKHSRPLYRLRASHTWSSLASPATWSHKHTQSRSAVEGGQERQQAYSQHIQTEPWVKGEIRNVRQTRTTSTLS